MDLISTISKIEELAGNLAKMRGSLKKFSDAKAVAISEYDKALALTMIKLKNGMITEFEGQHIDTLPATLIEKIAKGICYKESLAIESAEGTYKSAITAIESLKAELNGYQSINRYSDYTQTEK